MTRSATLVLLIVVIVALSVGAGAAYVALSINNGNTVVTDMSITATAKTVEYGGEFPKNITTQTKLIFIPTAEYERESGSIYDPVGYSHRVLTGTLDINCGDNGAILDIWVNFWDTRSLMLMDSITFTYNNTNYVMFNYETDTVEGSVPQSGLTTSIPVIDGYDQPFTITVMYKENVSPDPSAFAGANIRSNVMFLLKPAP